MWVSYLRGPACSYVIEYTKRVGFFVWLSLRVVQTVMQWIIPKGLDISCWDILHTDLCMQLCNRSYQKGWIFLVWVSYSWVCACSYATDYTKKKCVVVIILLFKIRYDFQVCKVMGIVNLLWNFSK